MDLRRSTWQRSSASRKSPTGEKRGEVEFTLDEVPEVASLLRLNNAQVNDFFFDGKLPTG